MNILEWLEEFYRIKQKNRNCGIPIKYSTFYPRYQELMILILTVYGLPLTSKYGKILKGFANAPELTGEAMDYVQAMLDGAARDFQKDLNCKQINDSSLIEKKAKMEIIPMEIDYADMYQYVMKNIHLSLKVRHWTNIKTGFRICWNYSAGRKMSNQDFKRSVDLYLTSIECPLDRYTMRKVVDLMLDYMATIGQRK